MLSCINDNHPFMYDWKYPLLKNEIFVLVKNLNSQSLSGKSISSMISPYLFYVILRFRPQTFVRKKRGIFLCLLYRFIHFYFAIFTAKTVLIFSEFVDIFWQQRHILIPFSNNHFLKNFFLLILYKDFYVFIKNCCFSYDYLPFFSFFFFFSNFDLFKLNF